MDGTLIDSESQTDEAIQFAMKELGITNASLDPYLTRGRTWSDITQFLISKYHLSLENTAHLENRLQLIWNQLTNEVKPIPGALDALQNASSFFSLGIVSSSPLSSIQNIMTRLNCIQFLAPNGMVGGDSVLHPKPSPEGFLLAASRLSTAPQTCLVFEDSLAGLEAARSAGMTSVSVLLKSAQREKCLASSDFCIEDYTQMDKQFWASLAEGVWNL